MQHARCCFQTARQSESALGGQDERSRAAATATPQNAVPVRADPASCSRGNSLVSPLSPGDLLVFWTQPQEGNRDSRSGLETTLQQMSPAWVSSVPSSACLPDALLFSACTLPTCPLGAAAGLVPSHDHSLGTDPSSSRQAWSSRRALFSAATPVPCALSQRAEEVWQQRPRYFSGCPFAISDPLPTVPWSPRSSSCHLRRIIEP